MKLTLPESSSMYVFFRKFLVLFLTCLLTSSAFAQVSVTVQIIPPYRYRITDYTSHPEQILITILNTTTSEQRVQLRGTITGDNGIEMRVRSNFKSSSPLVMSPGEMKVLNGGDFTAFFNLDNIDYVGITQAEAIRGNGLPEANYRLCIRAFNYDTNVPLSAQEPAGCSNNFSITNIEPPVVVSPSDGMEITSTSVQLLNLSWSTPPGAPPATWYRIRIVEITGNRNPNDAIMSATQPYFFEKEVMGNMYVYSPADPQLTLGRRYAMMVTAYDPNGFTNFRNNGQSIVTSFKYGTVPAFSNSVGGGGAPGGAPAPAGGSGGLLVETTATPVVAVNSIIKGQVSFAYSSAEQSDETGTATLLGTAPIAEAVSSQPLSNPTPGTTKYNLNNAQVTLYGKMFSGEITVLGTAQSGSDGNYSISINTALADNCQEFYIIAKHTDNQLYPAFQTVKLIRNTTSYDTNIGTAVLQIISMQVKPFVVSKSATFSGLSVNFLLNQTKYNASPVMKQVFGNSPETVSYNSVTYVVLSKRNNANTFKRLFRSTVVDDYLVQITSSGVTPMYYPLGTLPQLSTSDTTKNVTLITKNFVYNPSRNQIGGILTFLGVPKGGTKITATITLAKSIRDGSTQTTFESITDESGYYRFANLPFVFANTEIKLTVFDTRFMEVPSDIFVTTKYEELLQTKNIDIKMPKGVIVGRVKFGKGSYDGKGGVRVVLKGTNLSTTTTAEGFYTIKVPFPTVSPNNVIECYADGYVDATTKFYQSSSYIPASGIGDANSWASYMTGLYPLGVYRSGRTTADMLGIGTGTMSDNYKTYFPQGEEFRIAYEAQEIMLTPIPRGGYILEFSLSNKKIVGGKVTVDGKDVSFASDNSKWYYEGTPGEHSFVIEPVPGGATFMKTSGIFKILDGVNYLEMKVILTPAMVITGVITDKDLGKGLAGAKVYVNGLPYEATTDANGKYVLTLPTGKEYTVSVVHPSYIAPIDVKIAAGETAKTVDFPVQFIDATAPRLQTLAGFPVSITKITKVSDGNFTITGSLKVASNSLYSVEPSNATLTFSDVPIKAKPSDINGIPQGDVSFKEAVMNVKAFNLANVEVQGNPSIKLKTITGKYIIGGDQLVLRLSASSATDNLPIKLPDALVKDSLLLSSTFNYVFSSTDIPELSNSRKLRMRFLESGQSFSSTVSFLPAATGNLEIKAGTIGSLLVNKSTPSFSNTGYSLSMYYQLPNIAGLVLPANTTPSYEWFSMKPTNIIQTVMGVSGKPFTATMQNFRLVVSKMDLSGLGTTNPNLTMSGKITVFDGANEENGTLTIKSLSLTTKDGAGTTLAGVVQLPSSGLTMNGLNFKTTGTNGTIGISYNFDAGSFEFKTSGTLNYSAAGGSEGIKSSMTGVFPIVVNQFQLRSKDWDLYMVASPNAVIDLKVARINIKTFLVNVGNGISMRAMAQALTDAAKPVKTQTANNVQLTPGQATWAIGLSGGVTLPLEGLTTTASASFVVGNVGSGPEIMLNDFDLEMKTPTFKLMGKVKLQIDDEKQGFEAAANLKMATKEFGAAFKYYNYTKGGFQIAASITTNAGVATGPIMWHNIGGGFDIDSRIGKYDVFLKGSFGPMGVPKTVAMVKDATVGILFDNSKCNDNPVIYGSGGLMMKDKLWGTMNFNADFCRNSLLVTVKSGPNNIKLVEGVESKVEGVLYALAPQGSSPDGALFLGFNAQAYAGAILKGNAFMALGYNFSNSTPGAPEEAKAMLTLVGKNGLDNNGTMNAIYLKGSLIVPNFNARFDAEIAGFRAFGFYYKYVSSGNVEMYYKYAENKFYAKSAFSSSSDMRVTLMGITLGAMAGVSMNLEGSYDGSWFVRGSANMAAQFYTDERASCNSINVTFCSPPAVCPCFSYFFGIPYPNGSFNCSCGSSWIPCGVGFKICTNIGADFNISSAGSSVNVRLY
ncbi:carboxypeptidase regulatory-like domain-containing protein [Arcicella sp. DC2W]|uniref:Carboxypeptidase regulatory-like domain-containing protein n=1 Tax=Arcicella gelida TaxID=2984195 RepID=A0ABU5S397_9BACT|nr:carboxypeptidase regulatory-like domain-containing protein [Arcicella sp. DC2W]MEA5402937.1 carboxypeptidase regulatory-like domain-containing protein [Arcicella sp. DC2W]